MASRYSLAMSRGPGDEGERRSGCLNLVLVLITASVATALTVAGVVLFFSFAALSFESPSGIEEILKIVVAFIAAYFLVRVGLSIWRDLRRRPADGAGGDEEQGGKQGERSPAEHGGG
jgi:hypothetical protein